MEYIETITIHSRLEDEIEFFEFLLKDNDVQIISSDIGLAGPAPISLTDIAQISRHGSPTERSICAWKTSCPNPLYWLLFETWYDKDWKPIKPSIDNRFRPCVPSPWRPPLSSQQFRVMRTSFKQKPISGALFAHGRISEGLSPIISIILPKDNNDFISITAHSYEVLTYVGLKWNADSQHWQHASIKAKRRTGPACDQSNECVEWHQNVFDWVRSHWHKWIIPRFTYRLGPESNSPAFAAQSLANLMGKNVAGFEPEAPVISPRDND